MRSFYTSAYVAALVVLAGAANAQTLEFRTYDGSANNLTGSDTAQWGAADTLQLRMADADYRGDAAFGAAINDRGRASARAISNALFAQASTEPSTRGMTGGVWQWGQFLDHDIDLTPTSSDPSEMSLITTPDDPYGLVMLPFIRSQFELDASLDRQQFNRVTSYIDASNVYGSSATRALALREMSGGRLKTSGNGLLLPTSDMPGLGVLDNANEGPESILFVAGDVRANEQLGLTAMHSLLMREHNRLADALSVAHASESQWDDERLYQIARRIVGAEVQAITYNEFLPALMGPHAPKADDYSYNPNVNATIANEFSTAFFRLGHSMLPNELLLAGNGGGAVSSVDLADAFFTPSRIMKDPALIEEVLMGLAVQRSQEIDTQIVDAVRNFMFAPEGQMGLDLAAINVQRGRDHGLPDYNTLRDAYDLAPVASFADITEDPEVRASLELLYGTVDNIDAWVGALAEDHLASGSLGPLMSAALFDQFSRLRDGDRFFYAGDPFLQTPEVQGLVDLSSVTAMDLLNWNTSMTGLPESFFMIPEPSTRILFAGLALIMMPLVSRLRVAAKIHSVGAAPAPVCEEQPSLVSTDEKRAGRPQ